MIFKGKLFRGEKQDVVTIFEDDGGETQVVLIKGKTIEHVDNKIELPDSYNKLIDFCRKKGGNKWANIMK